MLKNNPEDFKPQEDKLHGMYRGVVEDNVDPEKKGRCKVRIFGVHTEEKVRNELTGVPTEDLPWAEPAMGLFEGSVSGFGSWSVPLQGSHVFLFFENGHILNPIFFATIPGTPQDQNHGFNEKEGFSDPDKNYPVTEISSPHQPNALGEPDFHRLARNEGTSDTIVESKKNSKDTGVSTADGGSWDEPDPYYSAEYPYNKVFSTHSGITIEIDDTEGEERVHVYHPSNSYIEINKDGSIIVRNTQDKFEIVDNNKKEHVGSDYDRTVNLNRTSKVGSNETEDVGGSYTRDIGSDHTDTIGGDSTINTSGETVNTSQNDSTVNGANVNLNQDKGTVHSIVTTGHINPVTGLPYPYGSTTCFAHKNSEISPGETN